MHPTIIRALFVSAVSLTAASLMAEDSPQQAAMGAKVYAENCTHCHEAPDPATRDARAWRTISLHMRLFADISKQEQADVLAFLRTFNVPRSK